jgi:hypothetical protein
MRWRRHLSSETACYALGVVTDLINKLVHDRMLQPRFHAIRAYRGGEIGKLFEHLLHMRNSLLRRVTAVLSGSAPMPGQNFINGAPAANRKIECLRTHDPAPHAREGAVLQAV